MLKALKPLKSPTTRGAFLGKMGLKNQKKRSNSETSEQSPPKKQKKVIKEESIKKEIKVLNGGGDTSETKLTASQRKRIKSKERKLAAIAKKKEEGGTPKSLWGNKKEKDKKKGELKKLSKTKQDKIEEEKNQKIKNRQEKRKQEGQYKAEQVNLSADEVRLRIAEIKGRENLTKTARRKLAVYVKKLALLEGTAVDNKKDDGEGETVNLSESSKRRLRREKKGAENNNGEDNSEDENDPGEEKPVDIQVFEKKKKQKLISVPKKVEQKPASEVEDSELTAAKNKRKQNEDAGQNSAKINDKGSKKKKIEEPEPSDDEEDDVEEEDDDDDDDDDDEDEEAEEEKEVESVEEKNVAQKGVKKLGDKGNKGPKKDIGQEQNPDKKKRYILFVGNVPFDSKPEDLKQHFLTKVGNVSSVRIPTKPGTQTPRGFAYVEVTNDVDYEKGLSLHHTMLNGRRINVEYTLSGSKQVNKRKELVSKNQKLHALRKAGKLAGSQKHDQKRSVRRFKKKEQDRQSN